MPVNTNIEDFKEGVRVRVFHGQYEGLEGKVTQIDQEYDRKNFLIDFEDAYGETHTFGWEFLEIVPERSQGREIGIGHVRIGDDILVEYSEGGVTKTHKGVVAERRIYFGTVTLYAKGGGLLVDSSYSPKITLIKAVKEPHILVGAKPGQWFRIDVPGGGHIRYTNYRMGWWVEEVFYKDGGTRKSFSIQPTSSITTSFDKYSSTLENA